ncbi:MAG: hypothetical protein JWL94_1258 [Microbacteriaceae bacterium]|nr:hypothetical protein [Microbacteriaceae bacterium]HEV7955882.1 hypothetical protein [Marisediminicola sp.]
MRFVLAIVSLVIAVGLAGYGFAQRTILSGPESLKVTSVTESEAPVTVIDGETLNALEGRQDLEISGSDTIFAAYARTIDVLAWVGDATYNEISFDSETSTLTSTTRQGTEDIVPAPAGSDLWLREYTGENELDVKVSLNEDFSILLVSDGTQPAPSTVSISWPLDNRTPWAGPLIAVGGVMLLLAVAFFVWAVVHRFRTRGPRRKSIKPPKTPRMPKLPKQRSYQVRRPDSVTSTRGRRSSRRMTAMIPVVLVGTLALSGCSAELWPGVGGDAASPSPSVSEVIPVEELQPPAATVRQVESMVRDIAAVAATADATLDTEALKARFAGPALDLRAGNYAIRAKDSAHPALPAIPEGPVEVTLPQQADETWPRSILAVVTPPQDESTDPPTDLPPVALTLVQQTPREQFKVNYSVALESDAVLPELPPEGVGVPRLAPDTKFLTMPPSQLAAAYVDVLNVGAESASYQFFDVEQDDFIPNVGVEARAARKAAIPATAAIEFAIAPGTAESVALASNESGALVTVSLSETETVKPVEAGATVNPEGATKTLSGVTGTTKGVMASYIDQLLFYIPPVGSSEKIVLLGFSQGLVSAQEIA